jgi:histidine ammonia-lyase
VLLDGRRLKLDEIERVSRRGAGVGLTADPQTRRAIEGSRELAADHIARGEPIHGATTGFGDSPRRQIGLVLSPPDWGSNRESPVKLSQ